MKIILIDDDSIVNYIHQSMFNKIDSTIEIMIFVSCDDALVWLKSNKDIPIDCILLDIDLPVSDGWEFLEYLNNLKSYHQIYIVTSSIADSDRVKSTEYKAIKGFLVKPVKFLELENIVSALR